jgi:hypothetical protein
VRSFWCSSRVTFTFGATTRFNKRVLPARVTIFLAQIAASGKRTPQRTPLVLVRSVSPA